MNHFIYTLTVIFILCLVVIVTRALPFVFSHILKKSDAVISLEKFLPAYIMLLLVIYEVNITTFTKAPYGLPAILALLSVVVLHVWKRITLLSIAVGTLVFVLLNFIHF